MRAPPSETELTAWQDLQNPHLSVGDWWQIAKTYPHYATHSPLFPLLTLEDPARWVAVDYYGLVISHAMVLRVSDWKNFYLFEAECVEHALWVAHDEPVQKMDSQFTERVAPIDRRARECVAIVRESIARGIGPPNWSRDEIYGGNILALTQHARAIHSACTLLINGSSRASIECAEAVGQRDNYDLWEASTKDIYRQYQDLEQKKWKAELRWQWERLVSTYLWVPEEERGKGG